MVSVQADCELEQAYVLMSEQAQIAHVSLEDIAFAVIDEASASGRIQTDPLPACVFVGMGM